MTSGQLTAESVEELRRRIQGRVVLRQDADFDDIRRVWNATIDRRPTAIVECASADDVPHAIAFARNKGLELSVRGAGHNIAGNAICNDGLMIDFSRMKGVRIEADTRRAYVQPGATLAEFDAAAQEHGLATPVGINSTTGIAGLTLGGGFGWLTRKYGMTVDNLVSASLVTAEGEKLRASETVHPDLFWALRGGGGNFGVVTEFEFKLHAVGPEVTAGLIVFPLEDAAAVFRSYRDFVANAPEELTVWAVMRHAPPLPFLPANVHGKRALVLAVLYAGDAAQGEKLISPLRRFGNPWGVHIGTVPYTQWQQAFDPLLTPGARNYWKSHNFAKLPDAALTSLVDHAYGLPGEECEVFVAHIGGAANRIAPAAMAYGHRDAVFVVNVHARWRDPAQDALYISWARRVFQALAPYASSGAYVNFMTEDEGDRIASAYGANHARLAQLKERYDPQNVFHLNQNIKPGVAA
jgi:FAD/FMN-containing dehydrogenase